MRRFLHSLLFAFSFLTAVPGLGRAAVDNRGLGLSVLFYPLVGLLLGALVYGVAMLQAHPVTRAVLAVMLLLAATRGLHADGLLDTFDGFLSGRESHLQVLEVMRDSRVGALGLVGAACVYGAKFLLLFEILLSMGPSGGVVQSGGRAGAFPDLPNGVPLSAVIIPAVAARGTLGLHCLLSPLARRGAGMGRSLCEAVRVLPAVCALTLSAALAYRPGFLCALLPVPMAVLAWVLWGAVCRAKIGGVTGDTLGAGIEITETAGYFILLLAARGVFGCW